MQIMMNSHNEAVDKEDKANMVDYKDKDATWRNKGYLSPRKTIAVF